MMQVDRVHTAQLVAAFFQFLYTVRLPKIQKDLHLQLICFESVDVPNAVPFYSISL